MDPGAHSHMWLPVSLHVCHTVNYPQQPAAHKYWWRCDCGATTDQQPEGAADRG